MFDLKELKYMMAYSVPVFSFLGLYTGFYWGGVAYAFVAVPLLELFFSKGDPDDHKEDRFSIFYELMLYANILVIYAMVFYGLSIATHHNLSTLGLIGLILSVGIVLGSSGINVAHELGHKADKISQFFAKGLLLPCLYTHFTIEHNRGHHLYVATPQDPATAKKDEIVYAFWLRSILLCYINAWKLEFKRLKNSSFIMGNASNEMIINTLLTIIYLIIIFYVFGVKGLLISAAFGMVSILLLESINYVEHYGLKRKLMPNGRYEITNHTHSWNSEHQIGRIVLYELTRHSDHHFKANKEYQNLIFYEESPQLPYGYPTSILLSLVPPLWFKIMNPRIPASSLT
jgi:alkane 1-monooxygenase